jgi:hypothetical protein
LRSDTVLSGKTLPTFGKDVLPPCWTARVTFPAWQYFFYTPQRPDRLWGPPSLVSNEYRGLFLGGGEVKRPGSEADHPPPSRVKVKNDGAIPPIPHMSS